MNAEPAVDPELVERVVAVLRRAPAGLLTDVDGTISRLAPDPVEVRAALLRISEPLAAAAGLRLTEGRLVLELRPPVRGNKGTALAALVEDYALAGVVFLGDDVTDLDAIEELRRLRDV